MPKPKIKPTRQQMMDNPIRTSLSFVASDKNEEEKYAMKQKLYWAGDYVFTKDQVAKMGTNEKMVLELIGQREYGKK